MQVKSIAEYSKGHSVILSTFIKLPVVFKIFVLSIFEWPFYTGFTVLITFKKHHYSNVHLQLPSGARILNFGLEPSSSPYFLCASSEGSVETAQMCKLV